MVIFLSDFSENFVDITSEQFVGVMARSLQSLPVICDLLVQILEVRSFRVRRMRQVSFLEEFLLELRGIKHLDGKTQTRVGIVTIYGLLSEVLVVSPLRLEHLGFLEEDGLVWEHFLERLLIVEGVHVVVVVFLGVIYRELGCEVFAEV